MNSEKRTSQDSARNYGYRLDGDVAIFACTQCTRYDYPACTTTGEVIKYPVTGPVGAQCPLEKKVVEG